MVIALLRERQERVLYECMDAWVGLGLGIEVSPPTARGSSLGAAREAVFGGWANGCVCVRGALEFWLGREHSQLADQVERTGGIGCSSTHLLRVLHPC